jgi:hypothetical protein
MHQTNRQTYRPPFIERTELDVEISLILSSRIAPGDPESVMMQTDLLMDEPIMTDGIMGLQ